MTNPVGRPLKYDNLEEMEAIIDAYFEDCYINRLKQGLLSCKSEIGEKLILAAIDGIDKPEGYQLSTEDIHPTVTGLALVLDLTRKSLIEYEGRDEFRNAIKKAKVRVESYVEQRLYHNNATGPIFNLKNNFGWEDNQKRQLSGPNDGPIEVTELSEEQLNSRLVSLMGSES